MFISLEKKKASYSDTLMYGVKDKMNVTDKCIKQTIQHTVIIGE